MNDEEKHILNEMKIIFPDRLSRYLIHSIKHPDHFKHSGNDLLTHCVDDILNFRTGFELDSYDLNKKRANYDIKHRKAVEVMNPDIYGKLFLFKKNLGHNATIFVRDSKH